MRILSTALLITIWISLGLGLMCTVVSQGDVIKGVSESLKIGVIR